MRPIVITILAVALALTGCQGHHGGQNEKESTLVTAEKLIDDGRALEAISLLNKTLGGDELTASERTKANVILASAYADLAGIKVQSFTKLIIVSKNKTNFNIKFKLNHTQGTAKSANVDALFAATGTILNSIAVMLEYYEAIPDVTADQEVDLAYAIKILTSLGNDLTPGDALYRAVLNVVYLKAFLASNVFDASADHVTVNPQSCSIDFKSITTAFGDAAKIAINILDDWSLAQPKSGEKNKKVRKEIANAAENLTGITTSASLLDEASLIFMKSAFITEGMSQLLKCQGSASAAPASAPSETPSTTPSSAGSSSSSPASSPSPALQ